MENKNLKLISTNDVTGVEVAVLLKCLCHAMGMRRFKNTDKYQSGFICRSLGISLLVKKWAVVGNSLWISRLGRFIGTGLADASRNRRLGNLAQG